MYDKKLNDAIIEELNRWRQYRTRRYRTDVASSATGPSYVETEVVYESESDTTSKKPLDDSLFRVE